MRKPLLFTVGLALPLSMLAQVPDYTLLSWDEYKQLDVRPPQIIHIDGTIGALLYFGVGHTSNPDDPQLASLEKQWASFRPTLALGEGSVRPLEHSRRSAIVKNEEAGLLRWLAARDHVPIHSLEPTREEQVASLLRDYSVEQVKVFYFLRYVHQRKRMKQLVDLKERATRYIGRLSKLPGLEGAPDSLDEIEESMYRLIPQLDDWTEVEGDWFNPMESILYTNEITHSLSEARDHHMVKVLHDEVTRGKRVFAVVGFSHVVVQEPALRRILR